jgi:ketosteroid isomerase-like protein
VREVDEERRAGGMASQLNHAEAIQEMYDAFTHRDVQRCLDFFDPRIEWHSAENFIYADQSPYVGTDAVRKLIFERMPADWDDFTITTGEILGGGELVIANGRFMGKFRANGASINAQFVQVFQLKDGKIARCHMYTDTAQFKETISRKAAAS